MENDRRMHIDRRHRDVGPPGGWSERRRRSERRLPTASVAEISPEDFARYFGSMNKAAAPVVNVSDEAAEVLGRLSRRI